MEEEDSEKLLTSLETAIKASGRNPKDFDTDGLRDTFKRKNDIMKDGKMVFMITRMADALVGATRMSRKRGKEPTITEVMGILIIMLTKLESDKHIKILIDKKP